MLPLSAAKAPPAPPLAYIAISMLGAAVAIGSIAGLSLWSGTPWLMAPFGATCVLAFGLPDSPLAQPRNIIGGHLLATAVGLAVLHTLGDGWLASALAVGLALGLMQWTRTVHAPAGANPLLVLATKPALGFLISPVLLGALVIVACALAVNNARQRGSYPKYWY
jgi:CBS-domain-containing membrane protein